MYDEIFKLLWINFELVEMQILITVFVARHAVSEASI